MSKEMKSKIINGCLYVIHDDKHATPMPLGMDSVHDWKDHPDRTPLNYYCPNDDDHYPLVDAKEYTRRLVEKGADTISAFDKNIEIPRPEVFVKADKDLAIPVVNGEKKSYNIVREGDYFDITTDKEIQHISRENFEKNYEIVEPQISSERLGIDLDFTDNESESFDFD